jgi:hippurate hydrolase
MTSILHAAKAIAADIAELRHDIHREPEIGIDLPRTQAKVLDALAGLPLDITKGRELSSVTAVLHGARPGPTVLLRGDMDALPVTEASGVPFTSRIDGSMHACGHDMHTAMLAGATRLLSARQAEIAGNVIFMFQPGEEGQGGADIMIGEGVLDAAGERPVAAYGLHVMSDRYRMGVFGTRPGPLMAAVDTLRVTVQGRGGHASRPHTSADPIPAACEMVTALQTMVTRHFDIFDPVVVTVGTFHAGTIFNVIPDEATFEATVRSFSPKARRELEVETVRLVSDIARGHGLVADARWEPSYPVTVNNPTEAAFARGCAAELFGEDRAALLANPVPGGEDFSYVLQQVPGAFIFLGACPDGTDPATAPSNHSARAVFDDSVLADGAAMLAELALRRLTAAQGQERLQRGDVRLLGANGLGSRAKPGELGLGEVPLDDLLHASGADLSLDAQVDAADAELAIDPGADRHGRAGVLGDRLRHARGGGGRGVVRGAGLQQRDDLAAAVAGPGDQRLDLVGR